MHVARRAQRLVSVYHGSSRGSGLPPSAPKLADKPVCTYTSTNFFIHAASDAPYIPRMHTNIMNDIRAVTTHYNNKADATVETPTGVFVPIRTARHRHGITWKRTSATPPGHSRCPHISQATAGVHTLVYEHTSARD